MSWLTNVLALKWIKTQWSNISRWHVSTNHQLAYSKTSHWTLKELGLCSSLLLFNFQMIYKMYFHLKGRLVTSEQQSSPVCSQPGSVAAWHNEWNSCSQHAGSICVWWLLKYCLQPQLSCPSPVNSSMAFPLKSSQGCCYPCYLCIISYTFSLHSSFH